MSLISRLFRPKKAKTAIQTGGFELLQRFTSADWDKAQKLSQYEKSMYVFACVNKIAEKVAETQFKLCQIKNSRGDVKEIINHPALDLLYNANPFQTRGEFLRITMIKP